MNPLLWIAPLAVAGLAGLFIWRRRAASDDELVSFVCLLKRPREIDEATVAAAVRRALGVPEPTIIASPLRKGGETIYLFEVGDLSLGVISFPGLYTEDPGGDAATVSDFRVKTAIQDHTAWLSVDLFGQHRPRDVQRAYRAIGPLIAEFAGDDCLALFSPATHQAVGYGPDLLPLLRSANPLAAFAIERDDAVHAVPDGQAEAMEQATREARDRWPEFADAFSRRRPQQAFAVKSPFKSRDGEIEFMWVEVERIDGATVHGRLSNDPQLVEHLKLHDEVTVSTDGLNDWLYTDGRNRFGGFTIKVLGG